MENNVVKNIKNKIIFIMNKESSITKLFTDNIRKKKKRNWGERMSEVNKLVTQKRC